MIHNAYSASLPRPDVGAVSSDFTNVAKPGSARSAVCPGIRRTASGFNISEIDNYIRWKQDARTIFWHHFSWQYFSERLFLVSRFFASPVQISRHLPNQTTSSSGGARIHTRPYFVVPNITLNLEVLDEADRVNSAPSLLIERGKLIHDFGSLDELDTRDSHELEQRRGWLGYMRVF